MPQFDRLIHDTLLRAPDGAGGGAAAAVAGPGAAVEPPPPGGIDPAAAGSSSSAAAGGQAQDAGAAGPYRPQGLPDNLYGANDRETIDRLRDAFLGYRRTDSTRGPVPDKPDGYQFEWSEPLQPYAESLAQDRFFTDTVRASALKHGLGQKQLNGFLNDVLGEMISGDLVEPPLDKAAERRLLLPPEAQTLPEAEQNAAIDRRMHDNMAWLQAIKAQGMPAPAADLLLAELGDKGNGHIALEWLRGRIGAGAQPTAGGGGGGVGDADLQKRLSDPRGDPSRPEYDRNFQAETVRLYKERFPG